MAAKTQDALAPTVAPLVNRRREPRHLICFGRPIHISWLREESLLATLIEVSRSGFRMSHQYRHFQAGQPVRVAFPWGEIKATVVWTRVGKKHVQTGFSVVEGSGPAMLCPK